MNNGWIPFSYFSFRVLVVSMRLTVLLGAIVNAINDTCDFPSVISENIYCENGLLLTTSNWSLDYFYILIRNCIFCIMLSCYLECIFFWKVIFWDSDRNVEIRRMSCNNRFQLGIKLETCCAHVVYALDSQVAPLEMHHYLVIKSPLMTIFVIVMQKTPLDHDFLQCKCIVTVERLQTVLSFILFLSSLNEVCWNDKRGQNNVSVNGSLMASRGAY